MSSRPVSSIRILFAVAFVAVAAGACDKRNHTGSINAQATHNVAEQKAAQDKELERWGKAYKRNKESASTTLGYAKALVAAGQKTLARAILAGGYCNAPQ